MKIWVLLAIAGLLLVWSISRERFEPTATIKAPPYDAAEKQRIWSMVSPADQAMIETAFKTTEGPGAGMEKEIAPDMSARTVERMYTEVYAPASTPITPAQIDDFVDKALGIPPSPTWQPIPGIMKKLLKSYFIGQGASRAEKTGYSAILTSMGQTAGYSTPEGASRTTMNAAPVSDTVAGMVGTADVIITPGVSPSTGAVPGGGMGTTTGSSTGGSSTSSMGPTSGNRSKQVFGPVFTAQGASSGGPTADSSKTNKYPELMGGRTDSSTRIEGVGVVDPSKNWKLTQDGSLPSEDSLGATGASKFFPTSRSPRDMDLIPDPYRLSRNFSTASYSSKTEPAPFLTDFSAFLK